MMEIHNAHKRIERSHDDGSPLLRGKETGKVVIKDPWEGSRPRGCGTRDGLAVTKVESVLQPYRANRFGLGASALVDQADGEHSRWNDGSGVAIYVLSLQNRL
jgi:hypothetical protein